MLWLVSVVCRSVLFISNILTVSIMMYFRDEEYDRGKVKKVRNKDRQAGFDVNPFQAVANRSKQRLQAEFRSNIDE